MPSRSLWAPFELGRPFGAPNDPEFQMDVLRSLFGLFARKSGPIIEDYPQDAPITAETDQAWSCTLPLPPLPEASTPTEALKQSLLQEVGSLSPWYEESMCRMQRSTFGLSGLTADDMPMIAMYLADVAAGIGLVRPDASRDALPGGGCEGVLHGSRQRAAWRITA
jgi:hypothetical protein